MNTEKAEVRKYLSPSGTLSCLGNHVSIKLVQLWDDLNSRLGEKKLRPNHFGFINNC